MSSLTFQPKDMNWVCEPCGQALALGRVELTYLGNSFHVELPVCAKCGAVYIYEELAMGRIFEVSSCLRTNELYASPPVRKFLGPALRPGGEKLTRLMLELAGPLQGAVALDAGCGCGASLALLRERGARPVGLDLSAAFLREARDEGMRVAQADLAELPLPDACLDLILCECAWNLTDKERVLTEFYRVLRPGGTLALADIYARGCRTEDWPVRCCFAQATDLQTVMEQVAGAGFEIDVVEEHTEMLKKIAADFVFRHGSLHGFWQAVTGDPVLAKMACDASRLSKPGLFLLMGHAG